MYRIDTENMDTLTRNVPRTVCEFASLILLHETQVISLQSVPNSWALHLCSGGWTEEAVSPDYEAISNTQRNTLESAWPKIFHFLTVVITANSHQCLNLDSLSLFVFFTHLVSILQGGIWMDHLLLACPAAYGKMALTKCECTLS